MDRFTEETYSASRPAHFRSEEDAIEWEANHQPEPLLSECCHAALRVEMRADIRESDTGYREEGGPCDVCSDCGADFEPKREPVVRVAPKPITRQQGELSFDKGVA